MATRDNKMSNAIAISPSSIEVQKTRSESNSEYLVEKKPIASKLDINSKSTILLRQPLPKYSFQVNNSKKSPKHATKRSVALKELRPIENIKDLQAPSSKPNSHYSTSESTVDNEQILTTLRDVTVQRPSEVEEIVSLGTVRTLGNEKFGEKPVKRVGPLQSSNSIVPISTDTTETVDQSTDATCRLLGFPDVSHSSDVKFYHSQCTAPEMEMMKKENTSLQTQLDLQLQVSHVKQIA